MNNYTQPGDVLDLTAPSGGVVSGNAYQIGQLLVVAKVTAAENETFSAQVTGVAELPKNNAQAWTEGALLYWDDTGKELTTAATGNLLVGCAAEAKLAADTVGNIRLNGIARANEA
jgi:predicted RecA/RadA family phage recombinase